MGFLSTPGIVRKPVHALCRVRNRCIAGVQCLSNPADMFNKILVLYLGPDGYIKQVREVEIVNSLVETIDGLESQALCFYLFKDLS